MSVSFGYETLEYDGTMALVPVGRNPVSIPYIITTDNKKCRLYFEHSIPETVLELLRRKKSPISISIEDMNLHEMVCRNRSSTDVTRRLFGIDINVSLLQKALNICTKVEIVTIPKMYMETLADTIEAGFRVEIIHDSDNSSLTKILKLMETTKSLHVEVSEYPDISIHISACVEPPATCNLAVAVENVFEQYSEVLHLKRRIAEEFENPEFEYFPEVSRLFYEQRYLYGKNGTSVTYMSPLLWLWASQAFANSNTIGGIRILDMTDCD